MSKKPPIPDLAAWWSMDGLPYREMAEIVGRHSSRCAGLAFERGFRRGRGTRDLRYTHGPCLGERCPHARKPFRVEELSEERLCSKCRTDDGIPVDVAAERRRVMERRAGVF